MITVSKEAKNKQIVYFEVGTTLDLFRLVKPWSVVGEFVSEEGTADLLTSMRRIERQVIKQK